MTSVDTLVKGIRELKFDITKEKIEEFKVYKELLKEWNKKINITSITDDTEIDIKHFIDSITLLTTNIFKDNSRVIDVGTGGGFPGIPLKIMRKDLDIVLLDSTMKKVNFLRTVIEKLGLEKITAIHGRAEEYGQNVDYREKFDIVVSRAVASLNILCEYCLPFVKVGGFFLSMKGSNIDDELNEAKNSISILGGKLKEVKKIELPQSDIVHSLIVIEKISETPTRYPRSAGKPKKKPL